MDPDGWQKTFIFSLFFIFIIYMFIDFIILYLNKEKLMTINKKSKAPLNVRDLMTLRRDIFMMDINLPISHYIQKLQSLKYTHIPVYEEDRDHIVGILNISKLDDIPTNITKTNLEKPYYTPETRNINTILDNLIHLKKEIAIVYDQYGMLSGLITKQTLIDAINNPKQIQSNYEISLIEVDKDSISYQLNGNILLTYLSDFLKINLPFGSSDTMQGFIVSYLKRIPKNNEKIFIEDKNLAIKILEIDNKTIQKLVITIY